MSTNSYRRQLDAAALATDEQANEDYYPDGLTEAAIDALLEDVDRELAADDQAVTVKFMHGDDQAHRTRRRAGRVVLRSLPAVVVTSTSLDQAA